MWEIPNAVCTELHCNEEKGDGLVEEQGVEGGGWPCRRGRQWACTGAAVLGRLCSLPLTKIQAAPVTWSLSRLNP